MIFFVSYVISPISLFQQQNSRILVHEELTFLFYFQLLKVNTIFFQQKYNQLFLHSLCKRRKYFVKFDSIPKSIRLCSTKEKLTQAKKIPNAFLPSQKMNLFVYQLFCPSLCYLFTFSTKSPICTVHKYTHYLGTIHSLHQLIKKIRVCVLFLPFIHTQFS